MRTKELTDTALDWAVAKCEGDLMQQGGRIAMLGNQMWTNDDDGNSIRYQPTINWAQAGPIIEREEIGVEPVYCSGVLDGWRAAGHDLEYDECGEYIDGSDHMMYGPTPLIAAMRCYAQSKLGDEVEVPPELL